jgi:hypothetical protein
MTSATNTYEGMVGAEGLEPAAFAGNTDKTGGVFTPTSRNETHPNAVLRAAEHPELVALASKARLLERLLVGDERTLATELRQGLEAMAGPLASVILLRRQ